MQLGVEAVPLRAAGQSLDGARLAVAAVEQAALAAELASLDHLHTLWAVHRHQGSSIVGPLQPLPMAHWLAAGLLVGLLLGQPWPTLTVAALGVVAWHYWKLRHVLLRLTARQRLEPPQGVGVWNELDRLLFRSQSEMRARKRRLLAMLRAYRAAAAALPDAVVVVERNTKASGASPRGCGPATRAPRTA